MFELFTEEKNGRTSAEQITIFKSVGHASEDLAAAIYFYNKIKNNDNNQ